MPGDITDVYAGARHDPALADGSGDPHRRLSLTDHVTEPPPVFAGEKMHQADYLETDSTHSTLPTEEELHTLRRVPDKIPLKAFTIAYIELAERLSYYGTTQVFVNFISSPNPGTSTGKAVNPGAADAQPGALGMGQQASTGLTTFNQFWVYLVPLFGAYVADTYLGRYKTIVWSVLIAIIGHVVLTASAAPAVIEKPHSALAAFIIGLIIMGIGTGGFKPNISPLVAEQIPRETMHVKTLPKTGERVIVDPAVTTARVYNWFYLFINVGALIGQLSMAYAERYVGFYLSFMLPTLFFCSTLPILYFCRNMYARRAPEGSVLGPAVKLLLRATKGRWHINPVATWKHMNDGTFWDTVKPSKFGANKPTWMTFDDAWVDEVGRGWAACSVFLWVPLYWITYNQINNNLTSQAATMSLHGVPNDVLSNLDPFALIIFIPICDLFLYPFLRKRGLRFTPIKKIAAGFWMGSAAMICACVVQHYIYKTSTCGSYAGGDDCSSPINVWAQTPSYVLIALSEIFASITTLEYGFSKAPKNMRSLVAAFALFMSAISAAIGEAFVPLSTDPLLVWNYGSMAVISFFAGTIFYFQYRSLDREEDHLNMLPTGHVGTAAQLEDVERRLSVVSVKHEEKI
ncbi:MFS peptide transporter-like protein Ptr2 [Mytilinidion resinicola]|uniref:MFS peptide transporter-like protein Ptr2 n=1 Tax=Mytilinidion resinicola TaxID=574789 RepID=A0A6A6Y929_9PEZI|nr:MFS peptide transporter-like protein Ptr2 [Mytilinidion resinicola]KAF2805322.1 MFS peptide transporter-like protein Ptr2 [Mytilinidion resinicola]